MKKNVLTLLAVLVTFLAANAQVPQGTVLVGAASNLQFSSVSPDGGDNYSDLTLDAKVGYFFVENLAGGLRLRFDKLDDFSTSYVGVFGRYYINGNIITGLSLSSFSMDPGGSFEKSSAMVIGLEGGYAAFLTDNIAIEPTLNLDLFSGDIDQTSFGFNVGFSLYLNR
ncbi:MAG TPA: hypothetical protein VEB86_01850 [Chryseosolibacter sp.]|nr:hypothetical protein [Chryseosolibacter sp.]